MKSFIFAAAMCLISTSVSASPAAPKQDQPSLIITAVQYPQYKSPLIKAGFTDSSFDYSERSGIVPKNKTMCYLGDAKDVCSIIRATEKAMNKEYKQGAHDNMDVTSCKVESDGTVDAAYTLSDDYDNEDIKVERTIKACAQ